MQTFDHTFMTPEPIQLYVEIGAGSVDLTASDRDDTVVEITTDHPDRIQVDHSGRTVNIVAERRTGFGREPEFRVNVYLPRSSELVTKLGSADLTGHGQLGTSRVKTGSGDVRLETQAGPTVIETGSGGIAVATAEHDLRVKTGSGDVAVTAVGGSVGVSTGSGDVRLGCHAGPAVIKTGSGSVHVDDAGPELSVTTGSGGLTVERATAGRLSGKAGSGELRVGIPAGVPVWTDLRTGSGRIRSDLPSTGAPADGQEYVELRATTGSGDIVLLQAG